MSGGIVCRLASSGFGLVAMHVERSMRIKRSVASGSVAESAAAKASEPAEDVEVDTPFDLSWSLDGAGPWLEE